MTHIPTNSRALLDEAIAELGLNASEFTPSDGGMSFAVTRGVHVQRVHISWSLLRASRNTASVRRAINHQLGEKVG